MHTDEKHFRFHAIVDLILKQRGSAITLDVTILRQMKERVSGLTLRRQ